MFISIFRESLFSRELHTRARNVRVSCKSIIYTWDIYTARRTVNLFFNHPAIFLMNKVDMAVVYYLRDR